MGIHNIGGPLKFFEKLGFLITPDNPYHNQRLFMQNKRLAVDMSCLLHQLVARNPLAHLREEPGVVLEELLRFFTAITNLGATAIAVFDGEYPACKKDEAERRHGQRAELRRQFMDTGMHDEDDSGTSATGNVDGLDDFEGINYYKMINVHCLSLRRACFNFCRENSIAYICSPYEADHQIAELLRSGHADIAVTNDSDFITLHCSKIIFLGRRFNDFLLAKCRYYDLLDASTPVLANICLSLNAESSTVAHDEEDESNENNELFGDSSDDGNVAISSDQSTTSIKDRNRGIFLYQLLMNHTTEAEVRHRILAMLAVVTGCDYYHSGVKHVSYKRALDGMKEFMDIAGSFEPPKLVHFILFLFQKHKLDASVKVETIKKCSIANQAILFGIVFKFPQLLLWPGRNETLTDRYTCDYIRTLDSHACHEVYDIVGDLISNQDVHLRILGILDPVTANEVQLLVDVYAHRPPGNRWTATYTIPQWLVPKAHCSFQLLESMKKDEIIAFNKTRGRTMTVDGKSKSLVEVREEARSIITYESAEIARNSKWQNHQIRDPGGHSVLDLYVNMGILLIADVIPTEGMAPPARTDAAWIVDLDALRDCPTITMEVIRAYYGLGVSDNARGVRKEKRALAMLAQQRNLNGFGVAIVANNNLVWIRSCVLPSMKDLLYQTYVLCTVCEGQITEIIRVRCQCVAGKGEVCSHAIYVCVLYFTITNPNSTLACTSKLQVWNEKNTLNVEYEQYVTTPLSELQFGNGIQAGAMEVLEGERAKNLRNPKFSKPEDKTSRRPTAANSNTGNRSKYVPYSEEVYSKVQLFGSDPIFRDKVRQMLLLAPKSAATKLHGSKYGI